MSDPLAPGTRIQFQRNIYEPACGDHPEFILCRKGDGGKIVTMRAEISTWFSGITGRVPTFMQRQGKTSTPVSHSPRLTPPDRMATEHAAGTLARMSDPIAYDHAMEDRHNREKQAAFAAHNFQNCSQDCEKVTLPGDIARLICEHIDSLEHEVHRLRNGFGRYGT